MENELYPFFLCWFVFLSSECGKVESAVSKQNKTKQNKTCFIHIGEKNTKREKNWLDIGVIAISVSGWN